MIQFPIIFLFRLWFNPGIENPFHHSGWKYSLHRLRGHWAFSHISILPKSCFSFSIDLYKKFGKKDFLHFGMFTCQPLFVCAMAFRKTIVIYNFWNYVDFYWYLIPVLQILLIGSSEEGLESCGTQSSNKSLNGNASTASTVRSNNAIHVCWHRGATVGLRDFIVSSENQLSGYLLRKFKNSSGWQKLWVVFTSFCLYFYKNYQDEFALASLPLLG